jgi:CheY-like chemotaxis protein
MVDETNGTGHGCVMSDARRRVWRVLVVDDEADLRRLMTMAIEFDDALAVVASASTGPEALALAEETQPDLAILDQMLGGPITGLDVAGQLRATYPEMRLILFSAASHEDAVVAGQVDELVTKTDIADLGDIARRVLEAGRDGAPTPAE